MDLTRLAVDAGQLLTRAVQYTEENIGQAEKTVLEPGLEELLARAEATQTWTERMVSQTEVMLQPSPGARMEERLYQHLQWNVPPRPRVTESLGDHMIQAGTEIGSTTAYGAALLRCGEAQRLLGEAEKKFVQSTNIHFLSRLRSFTEGGYREIQSERRALVNRRLDLDVAKSRLRKAQQAEDESTNLNANPLEDDYVSHVSYMFGFLRVKWLKLWAQEIQQAEMELRICQSLFDRQTEITKRALLGLDDTHSNHAGSLRDFVDAQLSYFALCHRLTEQLPHQLASLGDFSSLHRNPVNKVSPSIVERPLPHLDSLTVALSTNNNSSSSSSSSSSSVVRSTGSGGDTRSDEVSLRARDTEEVTWNTSHPQPGNHQ